ncbi:UpxY family transcription antiterminator [Flammeovirga pectinis]|nr:UpxY family transcription antiterminator [Flammeovirga pectinis]
MAIYTKPRAEKKVAERLADRGYEVYCPTYTTLRQWSDRKKKVTLPAIPSYVFIRIQENLRWEVLKDTAALNFVFWQGKPAVLRDEHIEAFRRFMGELSDTSTVNMADLTSGDRVLIKKGNFDGTEANILKINKKDITLLLPELGIKLVCQHEDIDTLNQ